MVEEGRLYLIHLHLDLSLSLTVLTYSKDVTKEALSGTVITDTDYYLGMSLWSFLLCREFTVHVNCLISLSLALIDD